MICLDAILKNLFYNDLFIITVTRIADVVKWYNAGQTALWTLTNIVYNNNNNNNNARHTHLYIYNVLNIVFPLTALLLIFGSFFAWETRKVQIEALNDSKEIGICVYNIMIMSVISVPISRLLPLLQMDVSFGVISIAVLVCAVTTLLLVFGPKVWP